MDWVPAITQHHKCLTGSFQRLMTLHLLWFVNLNTVYRDNNVVVSSQPDQTIRVYGPGRTLKPIIAAFGCHHEAHHITNRGGALQIALE